MFDADARKAELQAIYDEGNGSNWAEIKAIAEPLGIRKPDGGWENAISLIVEAEQSSFEPTQKPQGSKPELSDTPWQKVRTDLYGNIIPNPWQS